MRSAASEIEGAALLAGCAGGSRLGPADDYDETGYATWYGEEAAGHLTASGERFDPAALTAAHRTLPLGSTAEVTDLATGRRVRVLVNDRGPGDPVSDHRPVAGGSAGAGHRSAPARQGARAAVAGFAAAAPARAPARVPARPRATGTTLVQVAAFSSEPRARALAAALGGFVAPSGRLYRVRLGPDATVDEAERARDVAVARGYGDAAIIDAHLLLNGCTA